MCLYMDVILVSWQFVWSIKALARHLNYSERAGVGVREVEANVDDGRRLKNRAEGAVA